MAFNYQAGILLVFLFLIGLNGCARRQPVSLDQLTINRHHSLKKEDVETAAARSVSVTHKSTRAFTPFEEIVVSLVFDSLDLLPNNLSSSVYDVIQAGIKIPDQYDVIDKTHLSSPEKEDIALLAGHIVQLVYGENIGKEKVAPQAILFIHEDRATDVDIAALKTKLRLSENHHMDAYNTCLSLLVNSLYINYGVQQKNKEGLYLRDSNNNLYFHKDLKFRRNASN